MALSCALLRVQSRRWSLSRMSGQKESRFRTTTQRVNPLWHFSYHPRFSPRLAKPSKTMARSSVQREQTNKSATSFSPTARSKRSRRARDKGKKLCFCALTSASFAEALSAIIVRNCCQRKEKEKKEEAFVRWIICKQVPCLYFSILWKKQLFVIARYLNLQSFALQLIITPCISSVKFSHILSQLCRQFI